METKERTSRKASIDLFLKKPPKNDMPRRGISLPTIDYRAFEDAAAKRNEFRTKQDEIQSSLLNAQLKAKGVTEAQWDNVFKQHATLRKKFEEGFSHGTHVPGIGTLIKEQFCRQVTVWECQEKVCVDNPVPFDVDEFWLEGDGSTSYHSGPSFNGNHADYVARVEGSSYHSGLNYHRRTKESLGAICLRASTVLNEQARVRQVGVSFDGPLAGPTGGMANGLYLDGQIYMWVPNSYGDGRLSVTFQVSIETPSGSLTSYVPSSQSTVTYSDPPKAEQNYADPYLPGGDYRALPPSRVLDLNQTFPAGTFFLVEARVSHWIQACGQESFASVWHDLRAQPYLNLESCSWVWPS